MAASSPLPVGPSSLAASIPVEKLRQASKQFAAAVFMTLTVELEVKRRVVLNVGVTDRVQYKRFTIV
jgi:hypothetical protein